MCYVIKDNFKTSLAGKVSVSVLALVYIRRRVSIRSPKKKTVNFYSNFFTDVRTVRMYMYSRTSLYVLDDAYT